MIGSSFSIVVVVLLLMELASSPRPECSCSWSVFSASRFRFTENLLDRFRIASVAVSTKVVRFVGDGLLESLDAEPEKGNHETIIVENDRFLSFTCIGLSGVSASILALDFHTAGV